MVTQPPQPPAGLVEAVRQAAGELLPARMNSTRQGAIAGAGGALAGETTVDAPRALYDLGLDGIVVGSGLEAARFVGWRTLVGVGARPVAMADSDADPGNPTVRAMNYGPFVAGLARAGQARAAGDARETGPGARGRAGLEERVLQVPALYFVGLWLHDEGDPGNDFIIPAAPAPPGLNADQRYPAAPLLDRLAALARERLAVDDHGVDRR